MHGGLLLRVNVGGSARRVTCSPCHWRRRRRRCCCLLSQADEREQSPRRRAPPTCAAAVRSRSASCSGACAFTAPPRLTTVAADGGWRAGSCCWVEEATNAHREEPRTGLRGLRAAAYAAAYAMGWRCAGGSLVPDGIVGCRGRLPRFRASWPTFRTLSRAAGPA